MLLFSVFLHPIMLRFGGSNMLQRGDYAREICLILIDADVENPARGHNVEKHHPEGKNVRRNL